MFIRASIACTCICNKQSELKIDHDADKTLSSFCRWQRALNDDHDELTNSISHHFGLRHDNAILLTRYHTM